MTDARPAAPTPAPPRWGRVFVGCAVVGGLGVLAVLVAFTAGIYWLLGSGRQARTAAVVSPHSQGVVYVSDLASDPGARALLGEFMARAQNAPPGGPRLPQWMREMQAAQARQGISQWLPREATISLEPRGDEALGVAVAVNLRGMVQVVRLTMGRALARGGGRTVTKHGRYELISFEKGSTALCFMDGTIVLAPDLERLRAAVDRLEPALRTGPPPEEPARTLPGRWDVHGWLDGPHAASALAALTAERGEAIAAALALEDVPAPPPGLQGLRFGLDLKSNSDADLALDLRFSSAGEAAAAEGPVVAGLRSRLAQEPGLTAALTPRVDGGHLRLDVALHDLDDVIGRHLSERTPRR